MTILEDARAALDTGPSVTPVWAGRSPTAVSGLTNAERGGRAGRTTLALDEDKPYEPDEDCWVCEMETAEYDRLAERGAAAIQGYEFETYQQGRASRRCWRRTTTCSGRIGLDDDVGEALKTEFNREVGKRVGELTGAEVDSERPDIQLLLDLATDEIEVNVNSAFVYGRYRKLVRDIPRRSGPATSVTRRGSSAARSVPAVTGRATATTRVSRS